MPEQQILPEKFIGNNSQGEWTKNAVYVVSDERLDVGGTEGIKSKTIVRNNESGKELNFISKEFGNEDEARVIVKKYSILRKLGYKVPKTARYYQREGKHFVLMSDISQDTDNKVAWGINSPPTKLDYENLLKINPTVEEIIYETSLLLEKLNRDNISINCDVLALTRHEGRLVLSILDARLVNFESRNDLAKNNTDEIEKFINTTVADLARASTN